MLRILKTGLLRNTIRDTDFSEFPCQLRSDNKIVISNVPSDITEHEKVIIIDEAWKELSLSAPIDMFCFVLLNLDENINVLHKEFIHIGKEDSSLW